MMEFFVKRLIAYALLTLSLSCSLHAAPFFAASNSKAVEKTEKATFDYDLHINSITGKGRRTLVCLHGYSGDYRLGRHLKKVGLKENIVSFNFPDHGIREGKTPAEKTTFGSIQELLPAIYVLKKCVVEKGLEEVDLYGFSAGGGAAVNVIAVLNTNKYDKELKAHGITQEDKQKILKAIQRGIVVLDAPLKSIEEVIDLRGSTHDLEVIATRYRENDLRPIDSLRHFEDLALQVIVYFQSPDTVISNRDDELFVERLKKYNKAGTTIAIVADEGGHAGRHASLLQTYEQLSKKCSMNYTTEKLKQKFLIGIELKTTNENGRAAIEIPQHWEKFYKENVLAHIPHKVSNDIYALYTDYEGDHTKPYSCIIGCEVSSLDQIPEGMVGREIPRASYAVLTAPGPFPSSLIETWYKIWNSSLKRAYKHDLEVYRAGFDPEKKPEVKVYIGVKP